MKFRLQFKTPDVTDQLHDVDMGAHKEQVQRLVGKFVKYGELVTIEFDTKSKTAKVVEA